MTYNIKKILVPVDLSESSLNALETAVEIAKKKNALLQILTVVDNSLDIYPEHENILRHPKNPRDVLTALVNSIYKTHAIKPEIIFEMGHVSNSIVKKALIQKSDLVVLGTHGESGYRDNYIGSTSYAIVKHSSCPVLVIPPNKKMTAFKKIIFPIRPVSGALTSYNILCQFLSAASKLEVLGLSYKAQENTKLLDSLVNEIVEELNSGAITAHTSWVFGNAIAENILNATRQAKADLLVITSALDVTTKPFFIGPHAQHILNMARIPMLCIKRPGCPSFA